MSEILKLVKMDLIIIKNKSVLPFVFFMSVYMFLGYIISPYAVLSPVLFAGFMIQPIFSIDEQNDMSRLYGSLPVSRRNRAIARFMSAGLITAIALVISMIAAFHSVEVGWFKELNPELYESYCSMQLEGITIGIVACFIYAIVCFILGIQYTLLYLFGASKEAFTMIATFLIIMGFIIADELFFDGKTMDIFSNVLSRVMLKSEMLFYIVLYGASVGFLLICALISGLIMEKREI